jgi:hypothetical protein
MSSFLQLKKGKKNMNNSFDVHVLVNGNRCKFYHHQGRTYIEAKHGSEYELEIRNNTWSRILCLASVDGLCVLTGETAKEDDAGYVIPAYSPLRIKGFRYSNDEVAAFKFTDKHNSYAKSQGGNEAAKNCGVIGFRLYNEIVKTPINVNIQYTNTVPTGGLYGPGRYGYSTDNTLHIEPTYGCCGGNSTACGPVQDSAYNFDDQSGLLREAIDDARYVKATTLASSKGTFDMGSTWGQKVESKVIETDFEKGSLTFSLDIYYASRQALIDMGVPINVGNQAFFPQSFPGKYATPPSGWRG